MLSYKVTIYRHWNDPWLFTKSIIGFQTIEKQLKKYVKKYILNLNPLYELVLKEA